MIDALFGSKTRVKLLYLFFNNPNKSFYVREITRLVDEQINSVRRELANLINLGVITSVSSDHKLFHKLNQDYEYNTAFKMIFSDNNISIQSVINDEISWKDIIKGLDGIRLAIIAGVLVSGSNSKVDILLVGSIDEYKVKEIIRNIEKQEVKTLNYAVITYDEFYYRLSVKDKFMMDILTTNYSVILDVDNVLKLKE